jgi:hypothetical protein
MRLSTRQPRVSAGSSALSFYADKTGVAQLQFGIVRASATEADCGIGLGFGSNCQSGRSAHVAAARNGARRRSARLVDPKADEAASIAETEAIEDLLATAPKTILGLRAAIEYLAHYDSGCEPTASGRFIKAALKSPVLSG